MIALVDCNNFFASCELVFNPKLDRKPLVILSNNDGVIISRSQKAKEMGIQMGDPAHWHRDRVKRGELFMLSSNFTLYADMSNRVMQTLASFSPHREVYSIDEAFLELTEQADPALREKALALRAQVKQWTGIPLSVGIAPTKTLAKLAAESAKKEKEGIFLLTCPSTIEKLLAETPLTNIWGIGRGIRDRLKQNGIYTAAQLKDSDDIWIRKVLGVTGYRTVLELRGTSCLELNDLEEKKKSILCSRSFSQKIETLEHLQEAVASFAVRAAEKLREQQSQAAFLSVFIEASPLKESDERTAQPSYLSGIGKDSPPHYRDGESLPFQKGALSSQSCHIQLPQPTSFTPLLISLAKEAVSRIYRSGIAYKRAGVILGDFSDEDQTQLDLLDKAVGDPKKNKLMEVVDQINNRYDKSAIRFAAQGTTTRVLSSTRAHVSPRFTTSWNELLKISG